MSAPHQTLRCRCSEGFYSRSHPACIRLTTGELALIRSASASGCARTAPRANTRTPVWGRRPSRTFRLLKSARIFHLQPFARVALVALAQSVGDWHTSPTASSNSRSRMVAWTLHSTDRILHARSLRKRLKSSAKCPAHRSDRLRCPLARPGSPNFHFRESQEGCRKPAQSKCLLFPSLDSSG